MTYEERKIIYDIECAKLKEWFSAEFEKAMAIPWSGGLDGEGSRRMAKLTREMSSKARELGDKYNIVPEDRN